MKQNTLKQLLMGSNYFVLNKQVVKILGIETGYLLTALIEASDMLSDEDGWFYQTIENIEEVTTLKRKKQEKSIKELLELGIMEQENRGVPCRRYFRINYEKLEELIFNEIENERVQTRLSEKDKLDCPKGAKQFVPNGQTRLYEKDKLYINKKNINKTDKEININNIPPIIPQGGTLAEEQPKKEKKKREENPKNTESINQVINFLNAKVGSNIGLKTKSAREKIEARLNEGYSVGDIMAVIEAKANDWLKLDNMRQYLVPATLFRKSNFEKYMQGLLIKKQNEGYEHLLLDDDDEDFNYFGGIL